MATIAELREQAKTAGIKGASRLSKADLEAALGGSGQTTASTSDQPTGTVTAADAGTTPDNLSQADAQKNASAAGADEVQAAFDEANAKGYWGSRKDPEPDSTYAFPNPNERVA